MHVHMKRRYEYEDDGVRRVIPADWRGDLDDTVAAEAVKADFAEEIGGDGRPVQPKPAKGKGEPVPQGEAEAPRKVG